MFEFNKQNKHLLWYMASLDEYVHIDLSQWDNGKGLKAVARFVTKGYKCPDCRKVMKEKYYMGEYHKVCNCKI